MRGTIVLDEARCKGCELCVSVCPKGLIQLADHFTAHGYRPAVLIDPTGACTGCLLCATVCPEAGITIYRAVRYPGAGAAPAADMRAAPVSEQGGKP
jgi:2-oxoglutarate ferredoxin oxidoreductase subunit delta